MLLQVEFLKTLEAIKLNNQTSFRASFKLF